MKQKKRDFSPRERRLIDGFIWDICRALRLPRDSAELYQCGWAAFLDVYRSDPAAFADADFSGWRRAYLVIWDALERENRQLQFWLYGLTSLDQPVSSEVPVPRRELLQAPHGDFQNGVCFHDYLDRMDTDARLMAYALIHGGAMEEIRAYYHWSHDHAYRTYNRLRSSMQEYLAL